MFLINKVENSMKTGDKVIYIKPKHSDHPSPRGINLSPSDLGEDYDYTIKKYWVVIDTDGETVACRTRRGKIIEVDMKDPHLRKATIWERLFQRGKFPN